MVGFSLATLAQSSWRSILTVGVKLAIGLSWVPVVLSAEAAWSAERIRISYGLIERSIPVASLRQYAETGEISPDLRTYTRFLDAAQQAQLRQALNTPINLNAVAVSQFLYTDQGEILLDRLGEVIRTDANLPGFYALRAALILAAVEGDLTLINVLEQFPLPSVRIDLSRALRIMNELETLVRQTQTAVVLIEQLAAWEAEHAAWMNPFGLPDLTAPGAFSWQQLTFTLTDAQRNRTFPVDLYLPEAEQVQPAPVIVISHGLGSDRATYAYLAEQLASYGFVVAVPEHPGSNAQQMQALISGQASQVTQPQEFVDRPLDIQYLLDQLEQLQETQAILANRMNLQQVGVVGQSFGGYTALALAGATINFEQLAAGCNTNDTLNLSLLLQCRALELSQPLPQLRDERVQAIIAINPLGSSLLGQANIAEIQIPVMVIGGSADTVTPALIEQVLPFTWLETADRYLVLLQGGTHFSTLGAPEPEALLTGEAIELPLEIIGPDPALAQAYTRLMATAFFLSYVAQRPQYRAYLNASYVRLVSQDTLPLHLIRSLSPDQLALVFNNRSLDELFSLEASRP